eukprot:3045825-Prymnesium_polylepis.1
MPLTLKEMENLSDEDRIVAYEEYYGRKILTPRGYKDENVKLRSHGKHKKSKMHIELMKQKSNND